MKDGEAWIRVYKLLASGEIAHHAGGDRAAIFDRFDAEAEAKRKGYVSFDDVAWEQLKAIVHEMIVKRAKRIRDL